MTKMNFVTLAACGAMLLAAPAMAASNPASVFCGTMGGRSVIATLPSRDEIGLCYLSNNQVVEEWTLFRMFKGKKPRPQNNPFRSK